ncbi:hypothetical protein QFZ83_006441 [Variovorax sp. W1I1]|nr:hypothetical protein [Variovorax sp. W1I1]
MLRLCASVMDAGLLNTSTLPLRKREWDLKPHTRPSRDRMALCAVIHSTLAMATAVESGPVVYELPVRIVLRRWLLQDHPCGSHCSDWCTRRSARHAPNSTLRGEKRSEHLGGHRVLVQPTQVATRHQVPRILQEIFELQRIPMLSVRGTQVVVLDSLPIQGAYMHQLVLSRPLRACRIDVHRLANAQGQKEHRQQHEDVSHPSLAIPLVP